MILLRNILVPTDFTNASKTALIYAMEFARKFGAKIHLLHIVQDVAIFLPETAMVAPSLATNAAEPMLLAANKSMVDFLATVDVRDVSVEKSCLEGNPLDEILDHAREKQIDLIILGTHGHTGLAHFFLGSLAEAVVRQAPCPVLSVRYPEHEFLIP